MDRRSSALVTVNHGEGTFCDGVMIGLVADSVL